MNYPKLVILPVCLAALFCLGGCALFGASPDEGAHPRPPQEQTDGQPPAGQPDKSEQAGLPGLRNPEAERSFAEARVLWRRHLSSLADAENCADPEKAAELLNKAISIEPAYADAYARRGLARSELGNREEAFDDLTTAIRLEPKPEYYAFRGLVSMRGGNGRAAARDFDYSLKKQTNQSRAYNFKGVLALDSGDKQSACKAFSQGCSNGDCSFLEAARKEKTCP